MTATDSVFDQSIPEIYDTHLVPLIFEPYAAELARRTQALAPKAVLELAAGSGVVTRAVAPVLDVGARYVATDLNPPMLERARAVQPDPGQIEWRSADALDLPFGTAEFDLLLCQFGVMFFPDKPKGYAEARRVLRPGGAYLFTMWDRIEANEFAHEVNNAMNAVFPDDPSHFMARTPHGHYDTDLIRRQLAGAGFADVAIDPKEAVSAAPSPEFAATAYCRGTPVFNEIVARDPARVDEVVERAAAAIRRRFGAGPIEGRIRGFVISARRP